VLTRRYAAHAIMHPF